VDHTTVDHRLHPDMVHQHDWCPQPPGGAIRRGKSYDQWGWDEEEDSLNFMVSSPEEVEHLLLRLEEEPDLRSTDRWPELTEWCSSCTATRRVKLVLPVVEEEEKSTEEVTEEKWEATWEEKEEVEEEYERKDASTQTEKKKRKGGRRSRLKRLLAFQLHLTVDKGLPLSRLLTKETEARSPRRRRGRREEEESASPIFRRVVKEEEKVGLEEQGKKEQTEEGREEEADTFKGAHSSCSTNQSKLLSLLHLTPNLHTCSSNLHSTQHPTPHTPLHTPLHSPLHSTLFTPLHPHLQPPLHPLHSPSNPLHSTTDPTVRPAARPHGCLWPVWNLGHLRPWDLHLLCIVKCNSLMEIV